MIDEDVLAAQVRWNIPVKTEPTPPPTPGALTSEESSITPEGTNELALMKLANELGVLNPSPDAQKQLAFIYDQLKEITPEGTYDKILESLNDYLIKLGFKYTPDRFMRVYLWMKLNRERMAIDREMMRMTHA